MNSVFWTFHIYLIYPGCNSVVVGIIDIRDLKWKIDLRNFNNLSKYSYYWKYCDLDIREDYVVVSGHWLRCGGGTRWFCNCCGRHFNHELLAARRCLEFHNYKWPTPSKNIYTGYHWNLSTHLCNQVGICWCCNILGDVYKTIVLLNNNVVFDQSFLETSTSIFQKLRKVVNNKLWFKQQYLTVFTGYFNN